MVIQLSCLDRPGIVARITGLIYGERGNILYLEQHVEPEENLYFMRVIVDNHSLNDAKPNLIKKLEKACASLQASLHIFDDTVSLNMAIFVTKEAAPLHDLLIKYQAGELKCKIPFIISNHNHLRSIAEQFKIPFHHLPLMPDTKQEQEAQIRKLLVSEKVDLIVLARYMQILSEQFVKDYTAINIHHGFLPAFKGKKPYHQAWERGVKIIGATAHYVTADLDEGPIIAQDVVSVTHHHSAKDMIRAGRDIERRVLTSAVKAHLEHRIILHKQRTIIFH